MDARKGQFDAKNHAASAADSEELLGIELEINGKDNQGYDVLDIFLRFPDYTIYRNTLGIQVQFSHDPDTLRDQRDHFSEISPELCELRYLTSQMKGRDSIFDHNLAEAIMLAMEGKTKCAKVIVKAALFMAVNRVTTDNMIRYVWWSAVCALGITVVAGSMIAFAGAWTNYVVAGLFGALGALFSIITRVQNFEMKPCQQSNMNDWMACIRVGIGLIGGFMLFLVLDEPAVRNLFNPNVFKVELASHWQGVALIGFLGGFAERLVRTMFKRTADAVLEDSGTAVQMARKQMAEGVPDPTLS